MVRWTTAQANLTMQLDEDIAMEAATIELFGQDLAKVARTTSVREHNNEPEIVNVRSPLGTRQVRFTKAPNNRIYQYDSTFQSGT